MKLELYNTTERVKTVPKYRYAGKFVIPAKGSVDIEDYMADFFAPYARVGIVVRVKKTAEQNTEQVQVEKPVEVKEPESTKVEEKKEVVEEKVKDTLDKTEEKSEDVSDKEGYTKESLNEKNMRELRDIASGLGIDISEVRKKDSLIDAILAK